VLAQNRRMRLSQAPPVGSDPRADKHQPVKIFGVGLSKTGSTSLGAALTQLGYRNIHTDQAFAPFLSSPGVFNFTGRYDHVDSVEDLPTAFYFEEMLNQYPNAKFILTVRDADEWYASFSLHQYDMTKLHGGVLPFRIQQLTKLVYGSVLDDRELWIRHYLQHNERVRSIIPRSQLLEIDVTKGQGWLELCAFLNRLDGPCGSAVGTGFAHENKKEERKQDMQNRGILKKSPLPITQAPRVIKRYAYASLVDVNPIKDGPGNGHFTTFLRSVQSIRSTRSPHEIVALVYGELSVDDAHTFKVQQIRWFKVQPIGRPLDANPDQFLTELEIAHSRARMRVLHLTLYDLVLMYNVQMIFHRNCDGLFEKYRDHAFVARTLSNTPFDNDLYFIKPSMQALTDVRDIAHTKGFSQSVGWLDYGPAIDWRRPSEFVDWSFRGATCEQGLLYYYYFCVNPSKVLATLVPYAPWESKVHTVGRFHISMDEPDSSLSKMLHHLGLRELPTAKPLANRQQREDQNLGEEMDVVEADRAALEEIRRFALPSI
jgi:hypothetical protein